MKLLFVAMTVATALSATHALAQGPIFHWGSDTRAMSQAQCMTNAKFAIGEVGMQVNGETGQDVAGTGPDASVLVTCLSLGERTYISVVGSSMDSAAAERARNLVRSMTMGPAS